MGSGPSSPVSTAADSYRHDRNTSELIHPEDGDVAGIFPRGRGGTSSEDGVVPGEINETGHVQEVERNFSLLSVCSVGIVVGGTWPAFGGSIAVAIS